MQPNRPDLETSTKWYEIHIIRYIIEFCIYLYLQSIPDGKFKHLRTVGQDIPMGRARANLSNVAGAIGGWWRLL